MHEFGHLIAFHLMRTEDFSQGYSIIETFADILMYLMTGLPFIGKPEVVALRGDEEIPKGQPMRSFIDPQGVDPQYRGVLAGNAQTVLQAELHHNVDIHTVSLLSTRFLYDLSGHKDFPQKLREILRDFGRWHMSLLEEEPALDDMIRKQGPDFERFYRHFPVECKLLLFLDDNIQPAGNGEKSASPELFIKLREVTRKIREVYEAPRDRTEGYGSILDFHLLAAILLKNSFSEDFSQAVLTAFKKRGGNEEILKMATAAIY